MPAAKPTASGSKASLTAAKAAAAAAGAAEAVSGAELVGRDVKVFWPLEKDWFKGTVSEYRWSDGKHYGEPRSKTATFDGTVLHSVPARCHSRCWAVEESSQQLAACCVRWPLLLATY
jgi:hypothetical protein